MTVLVIRLLLLNIFSLIGLASPDELDDITEMSLRVNDFLTGLFFGIGIRLIDFKLEFGRLKTDQGVQIVLADELSPDNCRLLGQPDR